MQPERVTTDGFEPQAALVRWTPSARPYAWHGFRQRGDRFSQQQVQAMVLRGIPLDTTDTLCVRRQMRDEEVWTPIGQVPGEYRFDCPVIGPGKGKMEGRVLVIAPSGAATHVWPDGWAHRPRGPRRRGAY